VAGFHVRGRHVSAERALVFQQQLGDRVDGRVLDTEVAELLHCSPDCNARLV
jgi:hypothetical protein